MLLHPRSEPQEVLSWLKQRYEIGQVVLTTAFGLEGCVLIDLCSRAGLRLHIAHIDTGCLFPATHSLREAIQARYPEIMMECWYPDLTLEQQAERYGDRLWERDPRKCCCLRKVAPLEKHLRNYQVWLTAIRRSQSPARSDTGLIQWDWRYTLLKVCPLAYWSRQQVWEYARQHDVPHHALHHAGYPSIGCVPCTHVVPGITSPHQYCRDGRWANQDQTECGIHEAPNGRAGLACDELDDRFNHQAVRAAAPQGCEGAG